jgi:hypothetical protein
MTSQQQHEFLKSVGGLFDRSVVQPSTAQLAQQLMEDPESQAMYFEFVELDIELQWLYETRPRRELFDAAEMRSVSIEESPQPASRVDAVKILPLPSLVLRGGRSFFSTSVLRYVALVALCLYGSFVLIAWNLRPDKLPSVAVVRDTTDVQWSKNASSKPAKSAILLGEPLKIDSGTVELELEAGAKLVVEGPADWSVEGNNSVSLRAGKLLAHVPQQAIGFTIEAPTAKIVDLGTEFGVHVTENGAADVAVKVGLIKVQPIAADGKQPSQEFRLSAGQGVRVESTKITPLADAERHAVISATRNPEPARGGNQRNEVLAWYRLGEDDTQQTVAEANQVPIRFTLPNSAAEVQKPLLIEGAVRYTSDAAPYASKRAMRFARASNPIFAAVEKFPSVTGNWILEVWTKADSAENAMIAHVGNSSQNGFGLYLHNGEWTGLFGGSSFLKSGAKAELGKWTHLALVYEDGLARLFVDAKQVGQGWRSQPKTPAETLIVGGTPGLTETFAGAIDELRFSALGRPFESSRLLFDSDFNPAQ